MYRISRNGQEPIIDVDTIEDMRPAIRNLEARRYDVDEITDPLAHALPPPEQSTKTSDQLREPWEEFFRFD